MHDGFSTLCTISRHELSLPDSLSFGDHVLDCYDSHRLATTYQTERGIDKLFRTINLLLRQSVSASLKKRTLFTILQP